MVTRFVRRSMFCAAATLVAPLAAQGLPPVPVPPGNPITADKANLGKALFWDEQLSSTRTVACGTCHRPETGGADPRSLTAGSVHPGADGLFGTADDVRGSRGVIGNNSDGTYFAASPFGLSEQVTGRKTPSMINAAFHAGGLAWDGRATATFRDPISGEIVLNRNAALESQAAEPPINDVEMGHFGDDWTNVVARIDAARPLALASNLPAALDTWIGSADYRQLFQRAFGTPGVTASRILLAIATYQRTLISDGAPIDAFLAGNTAALTAQQRRGRNVFNGPGRCDLCHQGALFGGQPGPRMFLNIGVRPTAEDLGRGAITGNPADNGEFKVPSLRNVALRGRFFHNGGFTSLNDVVNFYNRGGDFRQNQTNLIRPLGLNPGQRADLVAFLNALTDQRVANQEAPFDRPTLYTESQNAPSVYGTATAGTAGTAPTFLGSEPPVVGNPNWTVGIADGVASSAGLLMMSVAPGDGSSVLGVALEIDPAAMIVVALGPLAPSTERGGYTSLVLSLPTDPALAGASMYLQAALTDSGAPQGVSATGGLQVTLFASR